MINAKKLGFGMMRMPLLDPDDPKTVDLAQVEKMIDLFMERGFTYFDTAWMYHGFESEKVVKKLIVDRYPRDSFTVTTKLHAAFFNSRKECEDIFNTQLEKTGAGYFDYYLLHGVNGDTYPKHEKYDTFGMIREKKEQGLVRHIGLSFHDTADVLDRILTAHPELEIVQLQINYLDWENDFIQSQKCYETAEKHGKPVIVMEGVKGGTLADVPPAARKILQGMDPAASIASWAVRFCASLPNVEMVLSGMSNLAQMEDNTSFMQDFVPLTEEQMKNMLAAADAIRAAAVIPCTGCSYCTDGCPMNINIPKYFSLYNAEKAEVEGKSWTPHRDIYHRLLKKFGAASECVECGQCEGVCPQKLPIIENLKLVAECFE